ncbi:toxin [Kitasatospora sp. NPDC094016]|uniref:toxin n=1 Tax=Kitasatospora sp. NPDC094016 TaxID=3154986 RepID=UPI0033211691
MPVPRGIRRDCEALLADLPIPDPFDVSAFVAALAKQRGRPIALEPLPEDVSPSTPTGLWVRLPSIDVVFYKQNTSVPHQTLIILHELGHMIWEHECRVQQDVLASIFPDLDAETVASVLLTRAGYADLEEAQAEMLALLLMEHVGAEEGTTRQGRTLYRTLTYPVRKIAGWRRAA